jgi:hypothetical protein
VTLRVFENRVLRRIFGPKRDEVTGEWRKLHNEELRDLYSSPSIISPKCIGYSDACKNSLQATNFSYIKQYSNQSGLTE